MKYFGKILCLIIALSLSLCALPPSVGAESPALGWEQADTVVPGESVTLVLSLPETEIAGGFITVSYDPTLLTLDAVTLADGLDGLTLTYARKNGTLNILLDAVQNVPVSGTLLTLTFTTAEEIAPGSYEITCTVPDAASFYSLSEDGTALPLDIGGCVATVTVTDPPLPPAPVQYLACQETEARDGIFSLRICAATNAPDTFSDYGFVCLVTDSEGSHTPTLDVSTLVNAIAGGGQVYIAKDIGYTALYCASMTLSAVGEVRIAVTPYAKVGDQILYGGTYTLVYRDGCYVKTEY